MKQVFKLQPLKVKENRFVYELTEDGKPTGRLLQWISTDYQPWRLCLASGPVAKDLVSSCWTEDECQAHCNYINRLIEEGKIA